MVVGALVARVNPGRALHELLGTSEHAANRPSAESLVGRSKGPTRDRRVDTRAARLPRSQVEAAVVSCRGEGDRQRAADQQHARQPQQVGVGRYG